MTDTKPTANRKRDNARLKRKATAMSFGVLLGAFAIVAATTQQAGHAANPATAPSMASASAPTTETATAGDDSGSAAEILQSATAPASVPPAKQGHAATRQS